MFIGREKELALLQEDYIGKAIMVYGKRRVGKTTLIRNALEGCQYQKVYFECLKGTMQDNINCPAAFSGTAVSVLTFVPFFIFLHQRSLRTLHISLIVQGETTHTPLLAACRICPSLLQISFRF